ncbi:I78 family peptidase inhibitor [Shimia sp.]|uniref:I78 family peptidase inhibitor n=1 Tax=Shimia sp. TaxID=1954381 RepID=UPI003B8C2192
MRFGFLTAAGVAGLAALAACKEEKVAVQGSTSCDPAAFEFLVGQDKSALEGVIVPEMVRVLGENDPATMDYHENRLNVVHNADGKVLKVSCG